MCEEAIGEPMMSQSKSETVRGDRICGEREWGRPLGAEGSLGGSGRKGK